MVRLCDHVHVVTSMVSCKLVTRLTTSDLHLELQGRTLVLDTLARLGSWPMDTGDWACVIFLII